MALPQKLDNHLLSAMSADDFALIQADLAYVELPMRQCMVTANAPIEHVYFVQSGIVSVVAESSESRQIEVGIIGSEGFSGLPLLLGAGQSATQEFVQVPGTALRMPAAEFNRAIAALPRFRGILLCYVHAFMTQTAQSLLSAGCDHLGPRLARWLLMCQDRVHGPILPLTHEFISMMLSVRRSGVTDTIHILEGQKLIKASRGQILILDRPGLLSFAGESYGVPEREYRRVISPNGGETPKAALLAADPRRASPASNGRDPPMILPKSELPTNGSGVCVAGED